MDYIEKRSRLTKAIWDGSCDGDCIDCPYRLSDDCESEYLADFLLNCVPNLSIEFHEEQNPKRFTAEEVRSMTSKEVLENYQEIMDSMKEW